MKKLQTVLLGFIIGVLAMFATPALAARTDAVWDNFGTYMKTVFPNGMDVWINGINHYLNFGTIQGTSGYGFRDNAGTMEFKDQGGSWSPFGTGSGGGGGSGGGAWATTTNNLLTYLSSQWTALIGGNATSSSDRLQVNGGITSYGTVTAANFTATTTATSTFPVMYSSTSTISNLNTVVQVDGVLFPRTSSGVQQALNLAGAGGSVLMSCGRYDWTTTVTVQSSTTLSGVGNCTYLLANASLSGDNHMIRNSDLTLGNSGIVLKNFKIDGNSTARTGTVSTETGHNISFSRTSGAVIENIESTNAFSANIALLKGSNKNTISGNVSNNAGSHGILIAGSETGPEYTYDNTVVGNRVIDAGVSKSFGVGIELAIYAVRNSVSGNTVSGSNEGGIHVFFHADGNSIVGNTINEVGQNGISIVDESNNNTISGNTIASSTNVGISTITAYLNYGGAGNTINDNVIVGNGWNGIRGVFSSSTISGNIIQNNGVYGASNQQYGTYITGTRALAFTGNYLKGNTTRGAYFSDLRDSSVSANRAEGHAADYFFDATSIGTRNNTVSNNTSIGSSQYGFVFFADFDENTVIGNSASGPTLGGLDFRGANKNVIVGNVVRNSLDTGLILRADSTGSNSKDNYIFGNMLSGNLQNVSQTGDNSTFFDYVFDGIGQRITRLIGTSTSPVFAINNGTNDTFSISDGGTLLSSSTASFFGTGTSTFTGDVNLPTGKCYQINGTCIGGGSFTNTLANGGTATTTFSNGGIVFSDSTKLTQDTPQLFWDDTNNRLGIGTTTPISELQVQSRNNLVTNYPQVTLSHGFIGNWTSGDILGNLSFRVTDPSATGAREVGGIRIVDDGGAANTTPRGAMAFFTSVFNTASNESMRISSTGLVGIGTTSPYAKLSVTGRGVFEAIDATSTTATSTIMGALGIGTTSPTSMLSLAGRLFVGGSGTSTFTGGLNVQGLFQVGTSSIMLRGDGTSTFSNGIDITSGCLSINGTCISAGAPGSGASSTLLSDGNNWTGLNTFSNLLSASSTLGTWIGSAGSTTNLFATELRATLGNFSNFFSSSSTIGTWLGTNGTTTNLGFTQATGTALTLSQPLGVTSGGSGSNDGSILGSGGYAKRTRNNITPTTISEMDSAFSDFYGRGTIAFSTTEYKSGTSSLSITVSNDGLNTGARWNTPDFDASRDNFSFWVKSTNWSQLATAELLLSTNGAFVSFFSVDLKSFLVSPPNNEWIEVIVPRSNFTRNGSPDWSTVNDIIFRATGSGGNTPTLYVDRFSRHKQSQQGMVAIVFDDGSVSQYTTAKPIMDKYNVPGTAYVIWNEIGIGGAMSQAQVNELSDMGWDIGGHGGTNLTTLSASALETDLQGMKRYLMKYGYRGSEHYALPNGGYSSTTLPIVQKYFSTQRTIDSFTNTANYINPARISAFSPSNLTATSTLYRKIDEAITNGDFLVLTFHKIVASPSTDTEWSTTQFTEFIEYVKNSGIKTVTMSEAISGNVHSATDKNDRVGYGTSTPYAQLSVWGNSLSAALMQVNGSASSTFFQVNNDGNVGIGTTSPYARLSVTGQVVGEYFTATSTSATSTFPNVNISNAVTLFGSTAASANALCVLLTGSADLCDGNDAGGAGGSQTPWTSNINAATFGLSGLSYVTASSTTATSSFNILSIGSTTPSSIDMFSVGSSSPLMSINGRSGKIGFGTTNDSPAKWAFGSGANPNINPNINLLVQDVTDARLGAAVSDNGVFLKAPTSDTGAAGIFAFNYQAGVAMDINLQEFGAKIGIGTSTPWAKFSVVPSGNDPAMVIATTTAWNSTGLYIKEQVSSIFSRNWWTTFIGGATSTDRYDRLGSSVTIFGRLNSDTLVAQVDPVSSAAFVAGLTADSVVTMGGPGWVFDDLTDGHLTTTSQGTTSVSIGGGGPTGITNGCNDGGAWLVLRANEATGATANDGAWVRGSGEFDVKNTVTGVPAAIPGGMLTSTGTPVMEVTICTPHMTTQAASSTVLAPASYAFGFGDPVMGAGPFSSTFTAPNNAAALVATNTENWILLNKNTAASASAQASGAVQVDTGVSTSTTLTSPQTFRIAMTATSTYAFRYNSNTGLWESIGVNTTQQTKRNFTWFIGVQKPGVAAGRNDLMFRNLKVWYSPNYRF